MKKILFGITAALFIIIAFGACSFNPDNGLAGTTWEYSDGISLSGYGYRVVFSDDTSGYYEVYIMLLGQEGTWSTSNFTYTTDSAGTAGVITFTSSSTTANFTISGNNLTWDYDSYTYEYQP